VFGTYDAEAHPRVQVVIDGLHAHGIEVEECDLPLGLDTASRVAVLKHPWKVLQLGWRIGGRWIQLWRMARRTEPADAILVPYLGHFDIHLARRRFKHQPIVLDHFVSGSDTAKDRGVSGPLRDRLLTAVDHAALRAADVAIVDTDGHRDLMPLWAQEKGIVVLVGATDSWLVQPRSAFDGTRPLKVIFFGLFTPLQGSVVIGRALGLLTDEPGIEITMVGEGQELAAAQKAAQANPRVTWLGMVPAEKLPAIAAEHDVCLGIFADNPKGLRVVPNKVYQGIRAGCAIVTSDTFPQRKTLGDMAEYVPPGDASALADTLRRLAADPNRVAELQAVSRDGADRFGPKSVVGPLVDWLEGMKDNGSRRRVTAHGPDAPQAMRIDRGREPEACDRNR
jgi:glycosyltransferase involved in cell wall biosynthesis